MLNYCAQTGPNVPTAHSGKKKTISENLRPILEEEMRLRCDAIRTAGNLVIEVNSDQVSTNHTVTNGLLTGANLYTCISVCPDACMDTYTFTLG